MIKVNLTDDYFDFQQKEKNRTIVFYGAGQVARHYYQCWGKVDYFCDIKGNIIKEVNGIPCVEPQELESIADSFIILVCIQDKVIFHSVCTYLNQFNIEAEIFHVFDNPAFQWFQNEKVVEKNNLVKNRLKINIVYQEDGWIFGKFARKLEEKLLLLNQDVVISANPDPNADVNHFISYGALCGFNNKIKTIYTTMITHIDTANKAELIKFQADHDALGICMSADTMNKLTAWGVKREKLCYINPAQDGVIQPRKIVIGITNKCHGNEDFRKRDTLIVEVCKQLSAKMFKIVIMGAGWNRIVDELRYLGYEVIYYSDFDREIYINLMPNLDYWLYYGFDEGAMGYLDAMAAGIKTIVTPQGYHLDTKKKPTYLCKTIEDFVDVLQQIQKERQSIIDSVCDWTWDNYAKKHLEIWQYLTRSRSLSDLYQHQSEYMDGFYSMLLDDNCVRKEEK